ncbi:hypothetical protein AXG93_2528s1710 [Marchantia polymorpha subsp. ruderalis]|uniref:Uncharacterized protein n=1 Tax=Marchantia polymorpha subsp. ruderalis TaxID=1480154 RepID=A0A176WQK6_MARPO|nr:hypothetical protein AXG93_2528s1710 [Marchantia polymorpha subsp. ruderalis]
MGCGKGGWLGGENVEWLAGKWGRALRGGGGGAEEAVRERPQACFAAIAMARTSWWGGGRLSRSPNELGLREGSEGDTSGLYGEREFGA